MTFDIKTLMLLYFILNAISAGTIAILWFQNRERYAGISWWLVNMIFQATGLLFFILRGMIPDFLSIVLANGLLMCGMIFLYSGLEKYVGKKSSQFHNYILLAVSLYLLYYFSAIQANINMREIIVSAMISFLGVQICWLLFRRADAELRKQTRITAIVLGSYVVVSLVKMMLRIVYPLNASDFFKFSLVDVFSLIMYFTLSACLTISLIIMVNNRLLRDVKAQEEKYTIAFHSSPYAIILSRFSDGVILEVNDGFVSISGYQRDETVGKTTFEMNLWSSQEDRADAFNDLELGRPVHGFETQFRKKSGEIITGLFSANTITLNNEQCVLSSISDITELSEIKNKLQIMATHDGLTGLPNRILFYDRFNTALVNAQRQKKKFAIFSLDLDHFKAINDTLGHDVGDKVLIASAIRLTGFLRPIDTVARFGGDEFILLLWEIDNKEDAIKIAQKIREGFHALFIIDEHKLILTLSIGIALYPEDGTEINALLKSSDEALYHAKAHGRDNFIFRNDIV